MRFHTSFVYRSFHNSLTAVCELTPTGVAILPRPGVFGRLDRVPKRIEIDRTAVARIGKCGWFAYLVIMNDAAPLHALMVTRRVAELLGAGTTITVEKMTETQCSAEMWRRP